MKAMNLFMCLAVLGLQAQDKKTTIGWLTWHPSGDQLLFSAMQTKPDWSDFSPDKWHLLLLSVEDGSIQVIDRGSIYAEFSPDGHHLAVARRHGDQRQLWIQDRTDESWTQITQGEPQVISPSWQNDGQSIVYAAKLGDQVNLYRVDLKKKTSTQLTHTAEKAYNPQVGPVHGDLIYYAEKGDGKDQIWRCRKDGTLGQNISSDEHHNFFPTWADPNTVLFQRGDEGTYRMQADGSSKTLVVPQAKFARVSGNRLAWSTVQGTKALILVAPWEKGLAGDGQEVWDSSQFSQAGSPGPTP